MSIASNPNTDVASPKNFALPALDGYPLTATFFPADSKEFIVLAGATAVPRGFYRRFAEYAQSRGINVITTDYRGIGDSKHAPLRGFKMEYADWSRYDLAAAVQWASARGRVWIVGHSLGGHALGQLPQPELVKAAYVCGAGAGWHGWMPLPERYRTWFFWHVVGPIATRLLGYVPMKLIGGGEDLPMGVYRDWKHWCGFPHYFFDDPKARAITEKFANVKFPIAATVSTDDLWAPPISRDAFFKGFSGTHVDSVDITANEIGVKQIGHMGYFRTQTGAVFWPRMLAWLEQQGMQAVPAAKGVVSA
jgi:predicted alpha/beta hydrolase